MVQVCNLREQVEYTHDIKISRVIKVLLGDFLSCKHSGRVRHLYTVTSLKYTCFGICLNGMEMIFHEINSINQHALEMKMKYFSKDLW